MKKIIALSCIITFTFINITTAQQLTTDSSVAFADTNLDYNYSTAVPPIPVKALANTKLRNMGIGLTILGLATIYGGSAMVKKANEENTTTETFTGTLYPDEEDDVTRTMGKAGIIGGSIATVGGLVMTYFGQRKLKTKKNKKLTYAISHNAMYIAYQF